MDEELTVDNIYDVQTRIPAWKWYSWDLSSAAAIEIPAEPFAALPFAQRIDGKLLFMDQRLTGDNGGQGITPFYELTENGVESAFIAYGSPYSMVRVR